MLAIWSANKSFDADASLLAQRLSVPLLLSEADEHARAAYSFLFALDEQGYSLLQGKQKIAVDFVAGASRHRRLHGGGRSQPIAKAVGIKSGNIIPSVLDATAGLGGDAFVLATLGCRVQLCERSPVAHALLDDGIARVSHCDEQSLREIIERMQLLAVDSKQHMQNLLAATAVTEKPDVVFLDPMFPEKRKNAAPKKEMAAFHVLVGADEDADALLPLALQVAQRRVVVKRPRHAPVLAGIKPSLVMDGESTRFDIYALRSMAADAVSV
ncbi:MAG: class I SAM-dependent methyltransferase [Cellvibrionales bacterium]|nr:class I SAM-dependent methyltransferase [Cellvibrionales bacterium]MBK8676054.1 class I SAM-dependent methyltransferase [Cellvibrionales bacterium]